MKKILTLLAVLASTIGFAYAQQSVKANNPKWTKHQELLKKVMKANGTAVAANKTRAADERLIADVFADSVVTDSTTYAYTGPRGSHLEPTMGTYFERIDFTTSVMYDFTGPVAPYYKSFRTYDGNNLVLSQIDSLYTGTNWEPMQRTTHTYNATNQLTLSLTETWSGTAWENESRVTYTYTSGVVSSETYESWQSAAWENALKVDYVYTGANLTQQTLALWNSIDIAWDNLIRIQMTYNTNNQVDTTIYQSPNGNNWDDAGRATYTYTAGKVSSIISASWSGTNWDNDEQNLFTYAGNNIATVVIQDWTGSAWENLERSTLTYNSNNYITSETYESWNGTAFVFTPSNGDYKQRFYYEAYNNNVSVNNVNAPSFGQVAIYPNPTQDAITISIEKNTNTNKQISVVNMAGATVTKASIEKNSNFATVNLASLPVGNYMVTITDETGVKYSAKVTKK